MAVEIMAVGTDHPIIFLEIMAVGIMADVGMSTTKKSNMPTDPMVVTTKKSNITADGTVVGITNKITLPTTGVVRTITGMRRYVDRRVGTRTADMEQMEDTPTVTATTMAVITIKDGNKHKGIEVELES